MTLTSKQRYNVYFYKLSWPARIIMLTKTLRKFVLTKVRVVHNLIHNLHTQLTCTSNDAKGRRSTFRFKLNVACVKLHVNEE